jgi:hypothetical protein
LLAAYAAPTTAATPEKRPTKVWNRTGPLGETPKHVTDTLPLSDQQNKGGWVKFEPMTDEFEGKELDLEKWEYGITTSMAWSRTRTRSSILSMGSWCGQLRTRIGIWPDTEPTSERILANVGQMVRAVADRGKQVIVFSVFNADATIFSYYLTRELRRNRDYHNARLRQFCGEHGIPLADICSRLRDEHVGDELHPNAEGARIIAEEVYKALSVIHSPP